MRLLFLIAFVAVFALVACSNNDGSLESAAMPKAAAMQAVDNELAFNLADVNDGKAHYFSYNDTGKTIRFFMVKASDGIVRAAFDACDVCYREKKGYRQDGNVMVCMNCGQRFDLDKINFVQGGCNPSPLKREFRGEQLIITKQDVIDGGMYF